MKGSHVYNSLIFHHLRYENHPALWYLVLDTAQGLGLRYDNIDWIAANAPLFLNEPLTFWDWNRKLHQDSALESALAQRPPIVVAMYYDHQYHPFEEHRDLQASRIVTLTSRGYQFRRAFCGAKPEDFREREQICYLIFQLP